MSLKVALPDNFSLALQTTPPVGEDPAVFTVIPNVLSFDEGNIAAEDVDVSSFSSAGNRKQYESGMIDASEGSFVVNYVPGDTTHEALRDAVGGAAQTLRSIDGDQQSIMTVLIKATSRPRTVGGRREMTVTIRLTGEPVDSVVT
jgi:hypothetical protein